MRSVLDGRSHELDIEQSDAPSIQSMSDRIKTLLTERFDEVKMMFSDMEEYQSQRMTPETLYQLLKR